VTDKTSKELSAKKTHGNTRTSVDYGSLNDSTKVDFYIMPLIDNILECITVQNLFCTLDIKEAYIYVKVSKESKNMQRFM
jgi:hypothetical protein